MLEQIVLNMKVHFKFYLRNRLLLVIGLIFLLMTALSLLPAIYMASPNKNFTIIKELFLELNSFTRFFTAGLGLFLISSHLKNRNIKMVLTKPCLPETWLIACFLSAAAVALFLFLSIFILTLLFSLALGIPFQAGFAFISIDGFLRAVVLLSCMVFLTMVMHPVLAVMIALVFNEGTVFDLKMFVMAIANAFGHTGKIKLLNGLIDTLYMALPITGPISENYGQITASMRVTDHDWVSLVQMAAYTAATAGLFYLLSDFFLRRKRLI